MDPHAHAEFHRFTSPSIVHLSYDAETKSHIPFRASTRHTHRTWAKTFSCTPELYLQPQSLAELRLIITLAVTQHKKLVPVGSGHSPSDLTCTPSWLLNLDNFASLVSADFNKQQLTIQAGMRLHTMLEELDARGWAMPTLGSITEQSIAGAIATSTHGSSLQHGLLSENVVELKLMLASGDVVTCSLEENTELFRAALVSLGALGVVVEVTVQAVPAYNVAWEQRVVTLEHILEKWNRGLWTEHEFIRCWWFPYTAKSIVWHGDKTDLPVKPPPKSWYGAGLGRFTYELLLYVARWFPRIMPQVEKFVFQMQYGLKDGVTGSAVQRSVEALTMDCLFPQLVNEWSIPLSRGPEAIRRLQIWLTAADPTSANIPISRDGVFVHAPIEVRVSNTITRKSQNPFLDQSNKQEPTLYLNATLYRPFLADIPKWKTYFEAFEYVMKEMGGKPHWAKNHISVERREFWEMYPEMGRWVKVREECDPERVFVNKWLERNVLGEEEKGGVGLGDIHV